MSHKTGNQAFYRILKKALLRCENADAQHSYLSRKLTRRSFIKGAVSAGVVASASLFSSPLLAKQLESVLKNPDQPDIAIIGAGLAGLTAAYYLKKAGLSPKIYEASGRTGGRILSKAGDDGLMIDMGAELINTDHADVLKLVKDFNISLFNRHENADRSDTPAMRYYFDGNWIDEETIATDLTPLAGQILKDTLSLEEDFEKHAPAFDKLSVTDYLNNHASLISKKYIRTIIENSIRSEYGVEPEQASALLLIFNLPTVENGEAEILGNSDETYSVINGSQSLTDALSHSLKENILLNKALTKISKENNSYVLEFNGEATQPVKYTHVILALPFTTLRDVTMDVGLPDKMQRFVREAGLGKNEKVIVKFDNAFWRNSLFTEGVWTDSNYTQLWDPCQRQPDSQISALNFYLGGAQVDIFQLASAKKTVQQFIDHLHPVDENFAALKDGSPLKTNWTRNKYSKGAYSTFKPGQLTDFSAYFWVPGEGTMTAEQEPRFDNLLFCGEHLSDAWFGFMNGAAETGRLAAESIVTSLMKS